MLWQICLTLLNLSREILKKEWKKFRIRNIWKVSFVAQMICILECGEANKNILSKHDNQKQTNKIAVPRDQVRLIEIIRSFETRIQNIWWCSSNGSSSLSNSSTLDSCAEYFFYRTEHTEHMTQRILCCWKYMFFLLWLRERDHCGRHHWCLFGENRTKWKERNLNKNRTTATQRYQYTNITQSL